MEIGAYPSRCSALRFAVRESYQPNYGQPFDVLFPNLVLPGGKNGAEAAEQAKQTQPNIKVSCTTGYAENAVAHHAKLDPDVFSG